MKAFPKLSNSYKDHRTDCEVYQYDDEGMDLRDHFAGLAMQARVNAIYINKKQLSYILDICEDEDMSIEEVIAIDSYKIADEMMEARK